MSPPGIFCPLYAPLGEDSGLTLSYLCPALDNDLLMTEQIRSPPLFPPRPPEAALNHGGLDMRVSAGLHTGRGAQNRALSGLVCS